MHMTNDNDILLINQDKTFLDYWVGVLMTSGYTVHTAQEMRGALSLLSKCPVGLIICGKELQGISGYDFMRFLKNDPLRENIPVMFMVSIKDQGRPLTAFELGAIDFLVYPVEPEVLISRIDEVFSDVSVKASALTPKAIQPEKAHDDPPQEPQIEETAVADIKIDVSRDGVIWLPGVVKSFSAQGLFIETALFGKPGVRLMLRFRLADGMFIANSHIKEMSFDDFQKPAGMAIVVKDDENWRRIHAELDKTVDGADCIPSQEDVQKAAPQAGPIQSTIVLPGRASGNQDINCQELLQAAELKKTSYDIRYYYSLIGKQLDNYRAITLIGSGSMGGVLQGWDVALEREVALKIISYELSSKQEFRDMFIKEARVISRLNHPNIAQIYSIGSSNQILYYAMEFIDGVTLKDILNREGTLNSLKGLEYLLTICKTLEFIYRSGVVHRDIKPANIMINNMGILKLVDFGVAKARDAKPAGAMKKLIMGTPLYMSPEQIAGLVLDHRSDMYSLGATFYHAFCGFPPFESGDFSVILDQHLKTPPMPLRERNARIAPALSKIIEKMLSKDPNERYKDFQTIITALKILYSRAREARRS
jgi:DNA-binding response OmpR family regulator/predicted Ser/Thr protein kinase